MTYPRIQKLQKTLFSSSILVIIFTVSCTPKPKVVEDSKTLSAEHLAMGKTIFENSCARCHDLPNPAAYSAQDWVGIMNSMAPKAKLTDEQHELTYNYVVSVRKAQETKTE